MRKNQMHQGSVRFHTSLGGYIPPTNTQFLSGFLKHAWVLRMNKLKDVANIRAKI